MPNNDTFKISKLSKESIDSFVRRIVYKIDNYLSKRVYAYPYRMKELYRKTLHEMINVSANDCTDELETHIVDLQNKINDFEKKISNILNDIYLAEYTVQYLEEKLNAVDKTPLLFKGDIKEHYYMEHKDMILAIIKEELKSEKDPEIVAIYNQILKENPMEKIRNKIPNTPCLLNRAELLAKIESILEYKQNERLMDALVIECGFTKEHNSHNSAYFFDDDQCPVTIATSTGDINFAHQMLRIIRKTCF